MMHTRTLTLAALLALLSAPVFAETTPPAKAAPVAPAASTAKPDDMKAATDVDEKREGKMRDRWRKMTPEQRDEMRQKAERRLQERFERLTQQEQTQITGIMAEMDKLGKEQRSVLMARIHEKAYKDRQQRKLMEEVEKQKPAPATPEAAAPEAPATPVTPATPATPVTPAAPEKAPVAPAPTAAPAAPAPTTAPTPVPAPAAPAAEKPAAPAGQ